MHTSFQNKYNKNANIKYFTVLFILLYQIHIEYYRFSFSQTSVTMFLKHQKAKQHLTRSFIIENTIFSFCLWIYHVCPVPAVLSDFWFSWEYPIYLITTHIQNIVSVAL